jgi:hypothetical protein
MFQRAVYTCIALCAAMLVVGQTLKSQAPAVQQWEVASVVEGPYIGDATTCIATSQGCQGQKITADSGTQDAMMQAASMLGEQGWELVGVTNISLPGQRGGVHMFFRRLKRK